MYQTIRYEKNGNIGIATINRPEALNALNSTVISELEQLISEVRPVPPDREAGDPHHRRSERLRSGRRL